MLTHDIFTCLPGAWALTRRVWRAARLTGRAIFRPSGAETILRYRESGVTVLRDGALLDSYRDMIYGGLCDGFAVMFDEDPPRLFHEAHFEALGGVLIAHCQHLCGNDTYATRYRWLARDRFTVAHKVTGPRKDYVMVSRYRKLD